MRAPQFHLFLTLFLSILSVTQMSLAKTEPSIQEFLAQNISSVSITHLQGNISVEKAIQTGGQLRVKKLKWSEDCELRVETKNQTWQIITQRKTPSAISTQQDCQADLALTLPKLNELSISHGMGDLQLSGAFLNTIINLGKGSIHATVESEILNVRLGSGNISLDQKTGAKILTLKQGSGNLSYHSQHITPQSQFEIKTGKGDVHIRLSKHAKLSYESSIGFGKLQSDFKMSREAALKLKVSIGMGELKLTH
jgi:hypothetical protein